MLVLLFLNTITKPTTSLPAGSRCRPKQLSQRSTFDTAGGDSDGGKSLSGVLETDATAGGTTRGESNDEMYVGGGGDNSNNDYII